MSFSIQTKRVTFGYTQEKIIHFPDIEIPYGSQWLISGKSGSGKTTFLHIITGILPPLTGEVRVSGSLIYDLKANERDSFRGKSFGIIFQTLHLIPHLTIQENLKLPLFFSKKDFLSNTIIELASELKIEHKLNNKPSQLSVGEQQRAAIVRALIHNPDILVADEPTSALDDENCEAVLSILRTISTQKNKTLIVVSHDTRLKQYFSNQLFV